MDVGGIIIRSIKYSFKMEKYVFVCCMSFDRYGHTRQNLRIIVIGVNYYMYIKNPEQFARF